MSTPQARVLALYSFGMVIAQSCGLTSVVVVLAMLLNQQEHTLRQRLRECSQDSADKRGTNRQAVVVTTCVAPLLQWVLAWWTPDERRLVLAMDATPLCDGFTVLSIAVVQCECAIPVAWVVVEATAKGGWQPHWCRLCNLLRGVVPRDWLVLVLADRGLYATGLFRKIRTLGWHPFLRINHAQQVRPDALARWRPITDLIVPGDAPWSGRVTCFTTPEARLAGTLLRSWAADAAEPWVMVTDLAPEPAQVAWYGMRAWIEGGQKDVKRGGWHGEQTQMDDPARAARLWLVIAVATLRVVSIGGAAHPDQPVSSLPNLSAPLADSDATTSAAPRTVRCFRRGMLRCICALLMQRPIPMGHVVPDPWPDRLPTRPAAPRPPPDWLATSRVVWLVLIALMQAQARTGADDENA